ncbi:MAG: A/G-specific adenine glycosylase [Planctomycetes bacterium]|nr:A/G-specific adenine glycosylase [Planctomycetota bacterium]
MSLISSEMPQKLLAWYEVHRRDLPWRRDPTPYRVWVSEVMLQQTQVDTVIPYYQRFLSRFPELADLARARLEEVLPLWSGLGYYRRARDLHAAARKISSEHGGQFPRDRDQVLALPGIGPYTAGAVLSLAFNLPEPVLDGNVERVLTRLLALPGNPRQSANVRRLREEARGLIPAGRAGDFNQALMELGALICLPLGPRCLDCPLAGLCRARRRGQPERFPEKKPAKKTVPVSLAVLVIERDGKLLLENRPPALEGGQPAYLRGLWNFPALEVEDPEQPPYQLSEAIRARWGAAIRISCRLGSARHSITFRKITLHVWRGEVDGHPSPASKTRPGRVPHLAWRWARPEELGSRYAVPSLAWKVLGLLQKPFSGPRGSAAFPKKPPGKPARAAPPDPESGRPP